MQPPTNFSEMPDFYTPPLQVNTAAGADGNRESRPRRRSSSQPPNADEENIGNDKLQEGGERRNPFFGGGGSSLQTDIAKMAWEAGSSQVKRAFFLYTNIDLFRPYFDVDPKQVRNRLFQSLLPRKPSSMQTMGADLYGPLMLIFTLVAVLLYTMKTSDYQVKDGTLIGTAFFTCFGYWFFASMGVYALGYVFVARVGMMQTFSVLGYALFGHCIVLGISALAHHLVDSHATFYALFAIFGVLSSLRMAIFFASKTPDKTHKLILACVVVALHLGFLLYLHFGYHKVVEELSEMLGDETAVARVLPPAPHIDEQLPIVTQMAQMETMIPRQALKKLSERAIMNSPPGAPGMQVLPPAAVSVPILAPGGPGTNISTQ